ncbi:maleylpyruvate isomerase family mycothiol-dependent enzyme [Streptomyces iconiensis]|uniref:Maleylpyruvate isomerase family mycothiol-dependent enzyme n=1 Tax=Streptomyces iconiensis TaxID=1384038 RepID=A0ABT7A9U2_9ACTN|nr:maleylpyruvate isomerase family mycothiol-dependent enzyme [Streptomyces iconiensis]MDJ1137368.1 maleylpyruvate isomerase family mycothiol-dependent enzyme [Streptomyces iconiensis]
MFRGESGDEEYVPHPHRDPESRAAARTAAAAELLERAVGYALGAARCVTPALLDRPTPCAGWDLGMLMAHVDDSLAALHEGMAGGLITLVPQRERTTEGERTPDGDRITGESLFAEEGQNAEGGQNAERAEHAGRAKHAEPADPAASFRRRASALLGAWASAAPDRRLIAVADSPLTAAAVALTGAVEIAVHGWDITRATGQYAHEVPAALARELLPVSHHLVPAPELRHPLFGPEVPVPPEAPPGLRLVAYLGRDPG